MKVIQSLADVQALERDEHLPSFYMEEIKNQFHLWYEAENIGEEIQDFSLTSWACIYHFNDVEDSRMLESCVNDIEYVETERRDGMKYFSIGIMQEHQVSVIYFLAVTIPQW